jgi:threonyl-tRNA synthetase
LQAKIVGAAREAGRNYQVVIEVPSQKIWDEYRKHIEQIPGQLGADVLVNIIEDGQDRYWIINVDYKIVDYLGQVREIGCVQIDIGNAPRLNIHYIDKDGKAKHPVIIHSAIPGGIERYLYLVFDNFEQAGLPVWLQPVHIRLLPVGEAFVAQCQQLIAQFPALRIEVDDRAVSVGAKLKAAVEDLVPHRVVIGQKEVDSGYKVLKDLAARLAEEAAGKPFIPREWPAELSRQL